MVCGTKNQRVVMPKLDEKKAELDDIKVYRNFALTSLLAVIGFVFTKITEIDIWLLSLCAFAVVVLGFVVIILQIKIKKLIKEIGEL